MYGALTSERADIDSLRRLQITYLYSGDKRRDNNLYSCLEKKHCFSFGKNPGGSGTLKTQTYTAVMSRVGDPIISRLSST